MKIHLSFFLFLFASQLFSQSDSVFLKPIAYTEVYFDFGKSNLDSNAVASLDSLFRQYEDGFHCSITAHTDSIGAYEANLKLSEKRARAVAGFAKQKGVVEDNIHIACFGEAKPKTFNDSEDHRRLNRRATVALKRPVPATSLEGIVKDPDSGDGVEADVIVHGKFFRDSVRTDTSGFFRARVPLGEVVGIDVYAEGFFMESTMLRALPGKMQPVELSLRPAIPGEKVDIANLYFVGNKAVLLEKSEPELPKILRFMKVNPGLKIQIAGHVNFPNRPPVSKNTFEYKLSVARAKMVYDYLIENGISADRLEYEGYGNWEMVYPKATSETQQAKNRRVEIRVLAKGRH